MEIDVLRIPDGVTGLVLNESAENASTLSIQYEGYVEQVYLTPVTLRRGERVLFHGKVTSFSHSNDGGRRSTAVTVTDALWLLEHVPFAAQVREILDKAGKNDGKEQRGVRGARLRQTANENMRTWGEVAASIKVDAGDWVTGGGSIRVDAGGAAYALEAYLGSDKVITAWNALCRMRQANPDALIHLEPDGRVRVVSISNAPLLEWDTGSVPLFAAAEISPLYENAVSGVAVCVTGEWEEVTHRFEFRQPDGSTEVREEREEVSLTSYRVYPEGLDMGSSGVKIFTGSANSRTNLEAQLAHMMQQARAYYEAVNTLQWGGSLTVPMDALDAAGGESPLMHRVNLSGTGAAAQWGAMAAAVTAVSWDFMTRVVTVTLGMQVQDPELHTLEFEEEEEESESESEGGGGGGEAGSATGGGGPNWTWMPHSTESSESESGSIIPPDELTDTNTNTETETNSLTDTNTETETETNSDTNTNSETNSNSNSEKNSEKNSEAPWGSMLWSEWSGGEESEGSKGSDTLEGRVAKLEEEVKALKEALEKLQGGSDSFDKAQLIEDIKEAITNTVGETLTAYTLKCNVTQDTGAQTVNGPAVAIISAKVSPAKNTAEPPEGDYILSRYGWGKGEGGEGGETS